MLVIVVAWEKIATTFWLLLFLAAHICRLVYLSGRHLLLIIDNLLSIIILSPATH